MFQNLSKSFLKLRTSGKEPSSTKEGRSGGGFGGGFLEGSFGGKQGCQDGRREEEGGRFKRRVHQGVRRGFTLAQLLTRHLERER